MTRDQIRATIEGLERIAWGGLETRDQPCRNDIARNALTLLREITSSDADASRYAIDMTAETMEGIDSERKAVSS